MITRREMGAMTKTLESWIDWLERAYGEGTIELDDLDKVELLELLKELEKRRMKDGA